MCYFLDKNAECFLKGFLPRMPTTCNNSVTNRNTCGFTYFPFPYVQGPPGPPGAIGPVGPAGKDVSV